jgi:AbrB family looped-hinge helix DNA binding protein
MKIVVSPKGRVIIPAALRKKYGLKPGTRLRIVDHGRVLTLVPIKDDPIGVAADVLESGNSPSAGIMEEPLKERNHK